MVSLKKFEKPLLSVLVTYIFVSVLLNSFSNGLYILSFICLTIWKNVAFSKQSCSVFWLKNRQHGLLPWEFKEMSSIKIVHFVSFLQTNDELLDKPRVVVCGLMAGTRSSSCGPVCQKNSATPCRGTLPRQYNITLCCRSREELRAGHPVSALDPSQSSPSHPLSLVCVSVCREWEEIEQGSGRPFHGEFIGIFHGDCDLSWFLLEDFSSGSVHWSSCIAVSFFLVFLNVDACV